MTASIIDGKGLAALVRKQVAINVAQLKDKHGITPGLAVVLIGDDPASQSYVNAKDKHSVEIGMNAYKHMLPEGSSEQELLTLIDKLNADPEVHGILIQLPLPDHINKHLVIDRIDPAKDVDGFHISNIGLLASGRIKRALLPCTPLGCAMLLRKQHGDSLAGMDAVVIGRSNIVGRPMSYLLLQDNCTVTVAHRMSRDIANIVRRADIVIAAVGQPELVSGDWIKKGATVIDVGINRLAPTKGQSRGRLVGDVDFASAVEVAGAITPVPGGVGPMTIACLLANTLTACCRMNGLSDPEGITTA